MASGLNIKNSARLTLSGLYLVGTCLTGSVLAFASDKAVKPPQQTGSVQENPAAAPVHTGSPEATPAPGAIVFVMPAPETRLEPIAVTPDFSIPSDVARNVFQQVNDLHRTTANLVKVVKDKGPELNIKNWNDWNQVLETAQSRLGETVMFAEGPSDARAWNSTVTNTLGNVAASLEVLSLMFSQNADPVRMLGNTIVDQADDVRETTGDLINALREGGAKFNFPGWEERGKILGKDTPKLAAIQETLMTDGDALDTAAVTTVSKALHDLAVMNSNLNVILAVRE